MTHTKLWRGLTTVLAVLLVMAIGAAPIVNTYANTLNNWLGTSNYKTVIHEGESNSDGTYFDSEFSALSEVVDAANELAVEISGEGSVLLKNNGVLPLNAGSEKITVWGLNSTSPILGGFIGSPVEPNVEAGQRSYGLVQALQERGFSLNTDMIDFYSSSSLDDYRMSVNFFGNMLMGHGLTPNFTSTYEEPAAYTVGEAPASAYTQDVLATADGTTAVVLLSRDNCEACDYNLGMEAGNPGDHYDRPLALSDYERQMISLAKEHSEKVVVLINASNPMEIKELKDDDAVDAILWVGTPGMNGFLGVADVLSGAVNPSGHLPDTFVVNVTSNPAMLNFGIMTYTNYSQASSDLVEADKGKHWNDLIDTGFHWGEWLEPGSSLLAGALKGFTVPDVEVASAYYAWSAGKLAEIAAILGKADDAKRYAQLSDRVKASYRKEFLPNGKVNSKRQCRYVRPIALDLAEEQDKAAIVRELNAAVIANQYRIGTGFLSTPHICNVLSDYGYGETAYRLLENEE